MEDVESGLTPSIAGDIVFDHVSFQYDDGDSLVLDDINFEVKAGETIAIMGPTGSGKSSLMYLLTRLYETTSGDILINGVSIKDIQKQHLRKNVGIVLQEPFLYSKTIKDNIGVATNADLEEINDIKRLLTIKRAKQKEVMNLFMAEKIARTLALVILLETPTPYVTLPLSESNI